MVCVLMMASSELRCVFDLCVDQNVIAGLREVSAPLAQHELPQPSSNEGNCPSQVYITHHHVQTDEKLILHV